MVREKQARGAIVLFLCFRPRARKGRCHIGGANARWTADSPSPLFSFMYRRALRPNHGNHRNSDPVSPRGCGETQSLSKPQLHHHQCTMPLAQPVGDWGAASCQSRELGLVSARSRIPCPSALARSPAQSQRTERCRPIWFVLCGHRLGRIEVSLAWCFFPPLSQSRHVSSQPCMDSIIVRGATSQINTQLLPSRDANLPPFPVPFVEQV